MPALPIKTFGEPILRKCAEKVREINQETRKIIENMFETMYFYRGIGLAAPQIGVGKRIIIAEVEGRKVILINPEIYVLEEEDVKEEGCLSLPGITLPVPRAYYVEVKGMNEEGKEITIKGEDLLARVIQHEIDHLNGVLILDYAPPAKKFRLEKNLKKSLSVDKIKRP